MSFAALQAGSQLANLSDDDLVSWILHVRHCVQQDLPCNNQTCAFMKAIIIHMKACHLNQCSELLCSRIKFLLNHIKTCTNEDCSQWCKRLRQAYSAYKLSKEGTLERLPDSQTTSHSSIGVPVIPSLSQPSAAVTNSAMPVTSTAAGDVDSRPVHYFTGDRQSSRGGVVQKQLQPLCFHWKTSSNVTLDITMTQATKSASTQGQGYVMTWRPLTVGESVVLKVVHVGGPQGSLTFGVTSCDPSTIKATDWPADCCDLMDRAEYWIVQPEVCVSPAVNDELVFQLKPDGEIVFTRNQVPSVSLMFADTSVKLWAFWGMCGTVSSIRLLGALGTGDTAGKAPVPVLQVAENSASVLPAGSTSLRGASVVSDNVGHSQSLTVSPDVHRQSANNSPAQSFLSPNAAANTSTMRSSPLMATSTSRLSPLMDSFTSLNLQAPTTTFHAPCTNTRTFPATSPFSSPNQQFSSQTITSTFAGPSVGNPFTGVFSPASTSSTTSALSAASSSATLSQFPTTSVLWSPDIVSSPINWGVPPTASNGSQFARAGGPSVIAAGSSNTLLPRSTVTDFRHSFTTLGLSSITPSASDSAANNLLVNAPQSSFSSPSFVGSGTVDRRSSTGVTGNPFSTLPYPLLPPGNASVPIAGTTSVPAIPPRPFIQDISSSNSHQLLNPSSHVSTSLPVVWTTSAAGSTISSTSLSTSGAASMTIATSSVSGPPQSSLRYTTNVNPFGSVATSAVSNSGWATSWSQSPSSVNTWWSAGNFSMNTSTTVSSAPLPEAIASPQTAATAASFSQPVSPANNNNSASTSEASLAKHRQNSEDSHDECVVCMERVPDCALYSCGHMCMCFTCAQSVRTSPTPLCPICQGPIKDVLKIFRP